MGKENENDKYGKCPKCSMYLPDKEWPMQCWLRGMLHPNTCPVFKSRNGLVNRKEGN